MPALVLTVRFLDGRYHGVPEWPPSPARLFQALVAGVARGRAIGEADRAALAWLETLPAPAIAAPAARRGAAVKHWVPNNDLDAKGGDPARVSEIRTGKTVQPWHFDAQAPFLYVWTIADGAEDQAHARAIAQAAERLYQLGRGVDMAWAVGAVEEDETAQRLLTNYPGAVRKPARSSGHGGLTLACPTPGSLASLERRFAAFGRRFTHQFRDRKPTKANPSPRAYVGTTFAQPPRPRMRTVTYDAPPRRVLFDVAYENGASAYPSSTEIVRFTEAVRDGAAARLRTSAWRREDHARDGLIDRIIKGRDAGPADKAQRVRITPLPSIGHPQADQAIRRLLVEVPPECPIVSDTIAWAFAGPVITEDGEIPDDAATLVRADDRGMLTHYGVEGGAPSHVWRTVTPAALPERVRRRRIDPTRVREEAKDGAERASEDACAAGAVAAALRHAGVAAALTDVRVQREPFDAKGARAEGFAAGTRFSKHQLWHIEMSFDEPVPGPLIIGDGRYLGLGLAAPVRGGLTRGHIHAFSYISDAVDKPEAGDVVRAVRRALMARLRSILGRARLPAYFSGHEPDGRPLRRGDRRHVAITVDPVRKAVLIVAPHVLDRRPASGSERDHLSALREALDGLSIVRAGPAGMLGMARLELSQKDELLRRSHVWASRTPYKLTRHAKRVGFQDAVKQDFVAECDRRSLPRPVRLFVSAARGSAAPNVANVTAHFAVAIAGPLLLGATFNKGGGLFKAEEDIASRG